MGTSVSREYVDAMVDETSHDPFVVHSDRCDDAIIRACVRFEDATTTTPIGLCRKRSTEKEVQISVRVRKLKKKERARLGVGETYQSSKRV